MLKVSEAPIERTSHFVSSSSHGLRVPLLPYPHQHYGVGDKWVFSSVGPNSTLYGSMKAPSKQPYKRNLKQALEIKLSSTTVYYFKT